MRQHRRSGALAVDMAADWAKMFATDGRRMVSNDSAAAITATRKDWIGEHRARYLASGGVDGHIEDLTAVGAHAIGTTLLLKYTGRKSGRVFISPLCYSIFGPEVMIIASKGGADHHPDWYLNVCAMDEVAIQIGAQAFRATWRVAAGEERAAAWAVMERNFPFYAQYQASTERVIPVMLLRPFGAVPLFQESDATGWRP